MVSCLLLSTRGTVRYDGRRPKDGGRYSNLRTSDRQAHSNKLRGVFEPGPLPMVSYGQSRQDFSMAAIRNPTVCEVQVHVIRTSDCIPYSVWCMYCSLVVIVWHDTLQHPIILWLTACEPLAIPPSLQHLAQWSAGSALHHKAWNASEQGVA